MQRLKISREGVILIKSFEGFRPHAVRRDDGRWTIGYGHTLSAREGAVVSEADAELLLQYDLLPISQALNTVAGPLNQHQFDALASFALSVGLDRFQSSDVLARLSSGSNSEAADAIVGWIEPTAADTPLRRRAAERALFVADPARPVALAELLSAPLPPPPSVDPNFASPTPARDTAAIPATVSTFARISAADDEAGLVPGTAADQSADAPAEIVPELSGTPQPYAQADTVPTDPLPVAASEPDATTAESAVLNLVTDPAPVDGTVEANEVETGEVGTGTVSVSASSSAPGLIQAAVLAPALPRYAAYPAAIVGPLPVPTPVPATVITPETPSVEQTSINPDLTPASEIQALGLNLDPSEAVQNVETSADDASDLVADAVSEATTDTTPVSDPKLSDPAISAEPSVDGVGEPLVLTPPDAAPVVEAQRLVWPNVDPATDQSPLFEDDGSLRLGAHQMIRHEVVSEEPRRIDWRETGLYILMGGFGLLTFGMSMAAFRRASLPSGGGEFATIAWVLAVFGVACIAVSAWNLYRKLGRAED
jgi:lysozyme